MARRTSSRLDKRREVEAAEALQKFEGEPAAEKKPAARKKAPAKPKKAKEKPQQRKRLLWGVYNTSNKEESRFPYEQKEAALEKAGALQEKTGKPHFVQPIKEVIGEVKGAAAPAVKEKPAARKAAPVDPDEDEVRDVDEEADGDAEAEVDAEPDEEGGTEFGEESEAEEEEEEFEAEE